MLVLDVFVDLGRLRPSRGEGMRVFPFPGRSLDLGIRESALRHIAVYGFPMQRQWANPQCELRDGAFT